MGDGGTASVVFWDKMAQELLHKTAPELKAALEKVWYANNLSQSLDFCVNEVI